MRERETKTERHSTATLSHRDTWRHKKRAMGMQVDAMTRTQTDTLGEASTWKQRG